MDTTEVKPFISENILQQLQEKFLEEKQVILHCCFKSFGFYEEKIRIWHSTFLTDRHSNHVSKLVHHENISLFPDWTDITPGKDYFFTLIFSGLPESCIAFDFIELIPQSGGFFIENIQRNKSDIYNIIIK